MNTYGYVDGNPINRFDASGTDWLDDYENFSAGALETLTLGIYGRVLSQIAGEPIDLDTELGCFTAYQLGKYIPYVAGAVGLVKGGLKLGARWLVRGASNGSLTRAEVETLQRIANEFKVELDIVGSRGAGAGRNIESDLPVGKGPGTRSDIDVRVEGQAVINSGGRLADALKNIGNDPNLVQVLNNFGESFPPFIRISPK